MEASTAIKMLDQAPIGAWTVDQSGKLSWVSATLAGLMGVSAGDLCGQPETQVLTASFEQSDDSPQLYRLGIPTGESRWMLQIRQPLEGGTAVYWVDATELMRLRSENDQLRRQVDNLRTTDELTGLLNRRSIMTSLEPQVSRSRRYQNPLSVVVMELESYESDAETLPAQDRVLVTLAYFLRDQLRWVDLIGRIDDGMFMLVLPETTQEDADKLIGKLKERVDGMRLSDDAGIMLSPKLHFGVASWQKGDDMNLLLGRMTQSLEEAKSASLETA